ncbi:MAG: branched-chain amino acid transport system II carrier protein [Clostridiales Family XIII bacterium]|jgi:LIVCS family branched-chain amino acid:cation transporter|nr:branched-chain amino acid transport system II carrier protein [Clostridiales Family XIII bacterium]
MSDTIETAQKHEKSRVTIVTVGFMVFAVFFGAGNLIFPPFLGFMGGADWWQGFIAFIIMDTVLGICGLMAAARYPQVPLGASYRIGYKYMVIFGIFGMVTGCVVFVMPRTAATAAEVFFRPVFMANSEPTSAPTLIFILIFLIVACFCAIRPSKVVDIIGKFLTPALLVCVVLLVILGCVNGGEIREEVLPTGYLSMFQFGSIEGLQTFDMTTGACIGVIIVVALQAKGIKTASAQSKTLLRSGIVAGVCLLVVYLGLAILGLLVSSNAELIAQVEANGAVDRTYLLNYIITASLGKGGTILMGIVVLLATLTTAIGSSSLFSQFFVRITKGKWQYKWVCIVAFICAFLMDVGSYAGGGSGVTFIINLALPIMVICMPAGCAAIILTLFTKKIGNDNVFRAAIIMSMFVGACEYFGSGMYGYTLPFFTPVYGFLGYSSWNIFTPYGFSWIIPTVVACVIGWFIKFKGFESRPYLRENADDDAVVEEL